MSADYVADYVNTFTLMKKGTDMNLYSAMIALGLGLAFLIYSKNQNGGTGTRPRGDALSWFVHTRLGLGSKSFLARRTELGVLANATIGELFTVFLYVGWLTIRFAYFIERNSLLPSVAVRVGKAFGELALPMLLMSYLLAQRYTIWGWVAGIPHERLIAYHRLHGWVFWCTITAHMICMATAMRQSIEGYPIVRQINSPMSIVKVNPQLGIAAYILWTFVAFGSIEALRRSDYGMFYANHFTFFPAAVLTLFHNRPRVLPWTICAAGFFYIDAGVRGYMKFMRKSKVEKAEVLSAGVAKLTLSTGPSMAYEAGQYIWVAFPGLPCSEMMPSLSFHPYTISSAYVKGDPTYTIHVKSMGDKTWSQAVVEAAEKGAEGFAGGCRVGGPSGRWTINPEHFSCIVLVAGGIGITPMASLLSDIRRHAGRYPHLTSVTLLWAVQSSDAIDWFAELLQDCASAPELFDLQLYVTRGAADAEANKLPVRKGRPDVAAALAAVMGGKGEGPVGVFACGPEPMMENCREVVGATKGAALLHQEVFAF